MSDRLIKESDVLRIAFQLPLVVNSAFADAVKALPSADRQQGEWIYTNDPLRLNDEWACNRCGNISFVKTNFCDRCGARMKGEDNDQAHDS